MIPNQSIFAPLTATFPPALQEVEVTQSVAIPEIQIIGLPSREVQESIARVKSALTRSGYEIPRRRVLINLVPASIRKSETGVDLAIALKLASEIAGPSPRQSQSERVFAWGELGLHGDIRPCGRIHTLLGLLIAAPMDRVILHPEDARAVETIARARDFAFREKVAAIFAKVQACEHLRDAVAGLHTPCTTRPPSEPPAPLDLPTPAPPPLFPLPTHLERRVLASLLGRHPTLILGPKGTGKSTLIDWFVALSPRPSSETLLRAQSMVEATTVPLAPAAVESREWVRKVSPHVHPRALIGGYSGAHFRPGELALAEGGLLVCDEFLEWRRDSREALREPLETKRVRVSSARGTTVLHCDFHWIGVSNLCACGGIPDRYAKEFGIDAQLRARCRCTVAQAERYLGKLSGPLLERIDLVLFVDGRIDAHPEASIPHPERLLQRARERWPSGADSPAQVHAIFEAALPELVQARLGEAVERLSLRGRHRLTRLARSFGWLDGCETALPEHYAEALQCRPEGLR